ncbi:MAG TPA: ATP-binding cassette domain-containing protein, partial [Afifellaceae bacterium]|nr:ATP-binding cassette domain-containing protein [Afifellaceae bacterium]
MASTAAKALAGSMNEHLEMTGAALHLADISHDYPGRRALEGVGFSVPAGRVTVLLGPNGAGKTTLFGLISRLLPLRQGKMTIAGHSLRQAGAAALEPLGIVFQQPTLDLDLTVHQNLTYFADLRGIARPVANERIAAGLEQFGLAGRADDAVRELNGGHRRRVEIVRATLHEPAILILDEPTVGLDIPTRQAIVADLHARAADGTAVLWATHLIDEVWENDRLVVLHCGVVEAEGDVAEVLEKTGADTV